MLIEVIPREMASCSRWFIWWLRRWLSFAIPFLGLLSACCLMFPALSLLIVIVGTAIVTASTLSFLLVYPGSRKEISRRFPRTFYVSHGLLKIAEPEDAVILRLSECRWRHGMAQEDLLGYYLPNVPAIILENDDEALAASALSCSIACGLSENAKQEWEKILAGVPMRDAKPYSAMRALLRGLMIWVIAISGVAVATAALSKLRSVLGVNAQWDWAIGVTALLIGMRIGFHFSSDAIGRSINAKPPIVVVIQFVLFGICGAAIARVGVLGMLSWIGIHVVMGLLASWIESRGQGTFELDDTDFSDDDRLQEEWERVEEG